jgi:uncharacterized RDD family membrane protein YckC
LIPPEALAVQGRRAGVVSRVCVMVIDAGVVAAGLGAAYLGWAAVRFMIRPREFGWPAVTFGTAIVAAGTVCVVYLTLAWSGTGRSVGARVFGLRVVSRLGDRLGLGVALLRALTCTLFPVLLLWCAVSRENRSVHDLVFRTSVVYDWRARGRVARGAPYGGHTLPNGSGDDALGAGVDVAPAVANEADDRHTEPLPRLDGE